VEGAAELRRVLPCDRPIQPEGEHGRGHPVADRAPTDARAEGHDLADAVGAHDHLRLHREGIGSPQHGELPRVEGAGPDAEEDLVWAGLRYRMLPDDEARKPPTGTAVVAPHARAHSSRVSRRNDDCQGLAST